MSGLEVAERDSLAPVHALLLLVLPLDRLDSDGNTRLDFTRESVAQCDLRDAPLRVRSLRFRFASAFRRTARRAGRDQLIDAKNRVQRASALSNPF